MRRVHRRIALLGALLAAGAAALDSGAPAALARGGGDSPPARPVAELLELLPVRSESRAGYVRTKFRLWIDADGNGCNTRQEVLIVESLVPPTVGPRCSISGGRWRSRYDGVVGTDARAFDIDHVVPLAEAWDSGASAWDAATRTAYANDLGAADSLIAVSASSNREKGDQDPATWLPPRTRDRCRYVVAWIATKTRWSLAVDAPEKAALEAQLGRCGPRRVKVALAQVVLAADAGGSG